MAPDGKALKDAEVRVEGKDKKSVATTKTDARGHYSSSRPVTGRVQISVVLAGAVKSSVNVKTTTTNSKIDFDLKPASGQKGQTLCLGPGADRNSYGKRLGRSG